MKGGKQQHLHHVDVSMVLAPSGTTIMQQPIFAQLRHPGNTPR